MTDGFVRGSAKDSNLGANECELGLSHTNRGFGFLASLCNVVLVFLERKLGSGMARTGQGSLVGCICHGDQNELMFRAEKIEASRECPQRLIGSIGAQQYRGCHWPTVATGFAVVVWRPNVALPGHLARSSRLSTLPDGLRGSASRNVVSLGTL